MRSDRAPIRPQLTIDHAQAEVNGCNHVVTRTAWTEAGKLYASCNCGRERKPPTDGEIKSEIQKLDYWIKRAKTYEADILPIYPDRLKYLRSLIKPKQIGKARHCSGWIESQGKTAKNGARSVYWFYRWEIWSDDKLVRTPARAIDPDRIGELRLMIHDKLPVAEILDRATEWQR
jgi:hypothetical protein